MNSASASAVTLVPSAAGIVFAIGIAVAATALRAPRMPRRASVGMSSAAAFLTTRLGRRRSADLRLCGLAPAIFVARRIAAAAAGATAGAVAAALWTTTVPAAVVAVAVPVAAGWLLPAQSVRDTARQRRGELHQTVNAWIVLTAQQVNAGAEPAAAMLNAAHANDTMPWQLLARHLRDAQNHARPAADGLKELAERYRLDGFDQALSALELAARRGTRLSDAVLAASDSQWAHSVAAEREAAQRHDQIIALPATAVALALAAILIYPPLVSLTGGIIATGP